MDLGRVGPGSYRLALCSILFHIRYVVPDDTPPVSLRSELAGRPLLLF